MIHCLGIKQTWSRQRLVPTSISAILSLIHFHTVLWLSPLSYPLLNYMPCIVDSLLALVTLLTLVLNTLTQLLLQGAVTQPLFRHTASLAPRWDEDFAIVLLRLGTASLEATRLAGLGNEVGGVMLAKPHTQFGTLHMDSHGVTAMVPMTDGRRPRAGFHNEVRTVKVAGADGDLWGYATWYKELERFGAGMWKIAKGLARLVWSLATGRPTAHAASPEPTTPAVPASPSPVADAYERFLNGDDVSDDGSDFEPPSRTPSPAESDSDTGGDAGEAIALYTDLASVPAASTALLLAHMAEDPAGSPLTRRRYKRLLPPYSDADERRSQVRAVAPGMFFTANVSTACGDVVWLRKRRKALRAA